ncbi:unnamed protein product [Chironomus riparius]|uniref:Uncharacterized protein n=1 Tax=Chironomus riparius TaxID=315576 RepID=A0A9N9WVR8_9DIPT|nr:unnamed protein product [Chironomus riparius]
MLMLNECYAIDDLQLPPRSLNVEKLKKQFPYLREVPVESYYDAIPCVLIGSRHAHMFEAIEPVKQGGSCKPVALKCKLGYTIYGGAPECHLTDTYALQAVATQTNTDILVDNRHKKSKHKIFELSDQNVNL